MFTTVLFKTKDAQPWVKERYNFTSRNIFSHKVNPLPTVHILMNNWKIFITKWSFDLVRVKHNFLESDVCRVACSNFQNIHKEVFLLKQSMTLTF